MVVEKDVIKKLQDKKTFILKEEEIFLPRLRELTFDGVDLEVMAIEYKAKSDALKNKFSYTSYVEKPLVGSPTENSKNLQEELKKSKQLLEDISKLNTSEEFYRAVQENYLFEEYIPLVTCANDYIHQQLTLFNKENTFKHFMVNESNVSTNHLSDISIGSKGLKFHLSGDLSCMDLSWKTLETAKGNFKEMAPNSLYSDNNRVVESINRSLNRIEDLTKLMNSFRASKYLIGKKKRAVLEAKFYTKTENEKQKIYQNYSHLLSAKESLDTESKLVTLDVREKIATERTEELLKIVQFLDEKLFFKITFEGILREDTF